VNASGVAGENDSGGRTLLSGDFCWRDVVGWTAGNVAGEGQLKTGKNCRGERSRAGSAKNENERP